MLEAFIQPSNDLCIYSYTYAQGYVERRLEGYSEPYDSLLDVPLSIQQWIETQGRYMDDEQVKYLPDKVYTHCMVVYDGIYKRVEM